jgi:hypothetical protein
MQRMEWPRSGLLHLLMLTNVRTYLSNSIVMYINQCSCLKKTNPMSLQGEAKVDKLFKFIEKLKELLQSHVAIGVGIGVLLLLFIVVGSVVLKKYRTRRTREKEYKYSADGG